MQYYYMCFTNLKVANILQKQPYKIAGFSFRSHSSDSNGHYFYRNKVHEPLYSMILTKAAFLHKEYMRKFSETLGPEILNMIDSFMNCEDIAMNVVISDHCKCAAAMRIDPRLPLEDFGGKSGLHKRHKHTTQRDECLNRLVKKYHYMPLQYTSCRY